MKTVKAPTRHFVMIIFGIQTNELCPFEFMPSPVTSKLVSVFLDGFNIIQGLIVGSEECNKIPGAQRESAEVGKNSL